MKICNDCGVEKELNNFRTCRNCIDGVANTCKACVKILDLAYSRSIGGFITNRYSRLKRGERRSGREVIISKNEFSEWLSNNSEFLELHENWVSSDYNDEHKPEIRIIDSSKHRTTDNLYITTIKISKDALGEKDDEKICTRCKKIKPLTEFNKNLNHRKDVGNYCKPCKAIHRKSPHILIQEIYSHQKEHSLSRGHPLPEYTKDELHTWMYENNYQAIYDRWSHHGFDTKLIPSVDRINSSKHYTIDNIQLITWQENRENYHNEVETTGSIAVEQLTLTGETVTIHNSINDASKIANVGFQQMKKCCHGHIEQLNGFKWRFADDWLN